MGLLIFIWTLYGLYIGYQVYDWMESRKIALHLNIVDGFFMKKIGIAAALLLTSVVLRLVNQVLLAKITVALPIGIAFIVLTYMILVWVFVWAAMYIGSK